MAVQLASRNGMGDAPQSLSNLFQGAPRYQDRCQRCKERVYHVEKVGPVNEVVFHKSCFRCVKCDHILTLRTYYTNPGDPNDSEVYCSKDAPKASPFKGLDASALGIRSALHAPAPKSGYNEQIRSTGHKPAVGSDAMHIKHPVSQSKYRKNKMMTYSKHHFPAFLVGTLDFSMYCSATQVCHLPVCHLPSNVKRTHEIDTATNETILIMVMCNYTKEGDCEEVWMLSHAIVTNLGR